LKSLCLSKWSVKIVFYDIPFISVNGNIIADSSVRNLSGDDACKLAENCGAFEENITCYLICAERSKKKNDYWKMQLSSYATHIHLVKLEIKVARIE
jgi:hypothetical protein